MSVLNVALLQLVSAGADEAANLAKGEDYCRKAAALGADVALFPEMWSAGYTLCDPHDPEEVAAWRALATPRDGAFVSHFRRLARELNMAIAITYLEKWEGAPRNSLSLIDRHGEIVLTYAKVHTCDFDKEAALTPGDGFYVVELDTLKGPVKLGAMICYDREFPESARVLMLAGAEIILTPNACTLERNRLDQFKTRAMENMLGVAMANYASPQENGHSVAYDPMAFSPDEQSRDMLIVEAGEAEGIYMAPFDLDWLREYRAREAWGDSYRKPRCYAPLLTPEATEPFVRHDSRR